MGNGLRQQLVVSLIACSGLIGNANASYSDLVFFGDSLSDTGNVLSLTTAFEPTPFPNFSAAPGRFSNGPVWTEYLAGALGFPNSAKPSNLLLVGPPITPVPAVVPIGAPGGQNYAYGGARTGLDGAAGPTTGLVGQLLAWNGNPVPGSLPPLTRAADPNALYVVFAGANDLRDARSANPGSTAADEAARAAAAAAVAGNVTNTLGLLAQVGARHFLVSNIPDLGKTPEAAFLALQSGSTDIITASTDVTLEFNSALAFATAMLDQQFQTAFGVDLDIRSMDFFGLSNAIYDDAKNNAGAVYGITNVTLPCINPQAPTEYFYPGSKDDYPPGFNCAVSAFSDGLHPSGVVHQLLGQLAVNAVPEPGSLLLALLSVTLIAGLRRRLPQQAV